jgi:redox-sensitive bicupin YhaK (pirin superfamily)
MGNARQNPPSRSPGRSIIGGMPLALTLKARDRPVGAFSVRRLLPAAQRQAVGPFLFFDHFGPLETARGADIDVRPHPHIGLATVTYLFEGAMDHRDSAGYVQRIEPGAVNWMTAGRGIVHSERAPAELAARPVRTHGLQLWTGLPRAREEAEPSFSHTPASRIPSLAPGGAQVRVLVGRAWGAESPVPTLMETLYLDIALPAGAELAIPPLAEERALYGVDHAFQVDGSDCAPHVMAVLEKGATVRVRAGAPARIVLIGGEPLDGHRFIWWNFVASSKGRIAEAAGLWEKQQMGRIAGETEWIPLPEQRLM